MDLDGRTKFLKQRDEERKKRQAEKLNSQRIIRLQALARGWLFRKHFNRQIRLFYLHLRRLM